MGVPYFQIKDIIQKHDITVFSSHFALYRDLSRRVFSVMRSELEVVEQYSIDEAFFRIEGEPLEVAFRVKLAVEKAVGIPVSVGVAPTKTLAKVANDRAKKSAGIHVLDTVIWRERAKKVPLAQIWGVGGKSELRYKQHGLQSVADLLQADPARVTKLFGIGGWRLQQELAGISVLSLQQKHDPQRSVMSSRSFPKTTTERSVLADAVSYHIRHAAADLRAQAQLAARLTVTIRPNRHGDFILRGGTKEVVLAVPTDDTFVLLEVAKNILFELYEAGVPYKKAGVVLSGLIPAGGGEQSLFDQAELGRHNSILAVVDRLNKREGKEVLLIGSRLSTHKWQALAEVCSPAYTTRWREIVTVNAK